MTVQTLTIDQLVVSEFNVRLNEEDANATTALEDSIEASGLWLPLVVHPITVLPSFSGYAEPINQLWGVLDGGRRCRSIRKLVDAGRLPADWPIDCVVRDVDPVKITELSLGAALLARELRTYEVDAAVARMEREGMAPAEIARNLGQPIDWVMKCLRLGALAPDIFAAYSAGAVTLDQAKAYGSVADQDLQLAAFNHLSSLHEWDRKPAMIRAFLKVGDRELEKLLRFVGEDAYRAAGGGYDMDLFADLAEQRGRVADEPLLRRLVEEKLGVTRKDLRRRTGQSDLRFLAEPPKINGYTDHALELTPESGPGDAIVLPAGAILGRLEIRDDGTVRTTWWWESRKAQTEARKSARKVGDAKAATAALPNGAPIGDAAGFLPTVNIGAAQQARAAVREEHGLTADGLHVVRSLRRELLRALLVTNATELRGDLGRDYLIWAQLRQELRSGSAQHVTGARGLRGDWNGSEDNAPADVVRPHLEQMEAHAIWERAVGQIRVEPFIALDDPGDALQAFVDATDGIKALAGAVLAGLALLRSANVPGWRIPAHDRLAQLAGGDDVEMLREFWTPNADFIALFPKLQRLELAQPFEDPLILKVLASKKDGEATRGATEILARQAWVHPLISFPQPETAKEPA